MRLLSFHYHLKINMDAPVSNHHFTLRCIPVSDERQRITGLRYDVSPNDYLSCSRDQWGNMLLCGSCHAAHTSFEANVYGKAETGQDGAAPEGSSVREETVLQGGKPAGLSERDRIFCFATPLTKADDALKAFSESLPVSSGSPEEAAFVMRSVYDALTYEPGSTTVQTTAAQAFAIGRGVCQDYAQIMLAVLREKGIPSRYVAGMLLGEGSSHAWVEVLHRGVWTAYDPTNCVIASDEHIKLSHGRDAWDCAINRGIFQGSALQTTEISVVVE